MLNTNPTEDEIRRHGWECRDAHDFGLPEPAMYKEYTNRDYRLFAILAGVRNNGRLTPIAPLRGVPADASVEYLRLVKQWGTDGHSHTWVTMEELFDQTWHRRTHKDDFDPPLTTTYLSMMGGFLAMAWDVLMEQKAHPRHLRLVAFFDN